jgi:hypothetical protein
VRNWLLALFVALPCALSAQTTSVPFNRCVYRLGDNPTWAAADVDPSGWIPYTEYRMTGGAYVLWVRCTVAFDVLGIQHPVLMETSGGPEQVELFIDGLKVTGLDSGGLPIRIFPISLGPAHTTHIVAVRVFQKLIAPGMTPGRPMYLNFGDQTYIRSFVAAILGDDLRKDVPVYSCYLLIGASGFFLLGL